VTGSDRDEAVPGWPNWLGLVVEDLEAARRFYGEVLGVEAMDAGDHWVQFDMGEQRIFECYGATPSRSSTTERGTSPASRSPTSSVRGSG
jgi:extradiol dioxygenase family protein